MKNFKEFMDSQLDLAKVEFSKQLLQGVVLMTAPDVPAQVVGIHMGGVYHTVLNQAFGDFVRRVTNTAEDAGWDIVSFKREEEPGNARAIYTAVLPEGFTYQLNLS